MKHAAGFTLVEVLVAMFICAVAGMAVMKASGDTVSHISLMQQQHLASWVAENQMVELQLSDKWPLQDLKKGKEEQAGEFFYWQHKVVKTQTVPDMVQVTVSVFADERREQLVYELTSYVAKDKL